MNTPARLHQEILTELLTVFHSFLKSNSCKVYPAPFDVRLPDHSKIDNKIDTVVQPDISVICDENKLDNLGCLGDPDLIIEILSPTTASRDHIQKRRLYEQHKVKEYWIIHPTDRLVTIYKLVNNKYEIPSIYDGNEKVSPSIFPELVIDLSEVFPKLPQIICENPPPGYDGDNVI